jgi:hypothetical protein
VAPPDAINTTTVPEQIVLLGEIIPSGVGVTEAVAADVALQPFELVTVTEYEVVEEGETEIELLVWPLFHE